MSKLTLEEATLAERAWIEWFKYRFGTDVAITHEASSNN